MNPNQTWMNVLPADKWTSLYSPAGTVLETFKLRSYSIVDGTPQMIVETKGGRKTMVGLNEADVGSGLKLRFYVPIELHQVPGVGLSPKLVFTMPRGCRVEEYRAGPPPEERLYEKARHHKIITLKG